MKKIVALALALALALSLCTVAMAADTVTYDNDDVTVYNTLGQEVAAFVGAVTLTKESTSTTDGTTTITAAVFQGATSGAYYETAKEDAAYRLVAKDVTYYVNVLTGSAAPYASKAATLYTAPEDATCGKVGADEDVYAVVSGGFYALDETGASTTKNVLVGNKVVVCSGVAAEATKHSFATNCSVTTKTDGSVVAAKCSTCKEMIPLFKNPSSLDGTIYQVAYQADGTTPWGGATPTYYYVVTSAAGTTTAAATTTTTTVDSSKTFDAGVAMYVGLSLMSVAGSAVVIGKKKEF